MVTPFSSMHVNLSDESADYKGKYYPDAFSKILANHVASANFDYNITVVWTEVRL